MRRLKFANREDTVLVILFVVFLVIVVLAFVLDAVFDDYNYIFIDGNYYFITAEPLKENPEIEIGTVQRQTGIKFFSENCHLDSNLLPVGTPVYLHPYIPDCYVVYWKDRYRVCYYIENGVYAIPVIYDRR